MKLIDKFLKKLNTSRNTFATYILTLITIYLAVDRIVELLLMIFTGVSYSYWGPIQYTLALACPIFAFLFSGSSEFASSKNKKVSIFYVYAIGLYIIAVSMFTQWLNKAVWLFLISVPNYVEIITDFSDLVRPALVSISIAIPLATLFPFFKKLYFDINDNLDEVRSIWDYGGISLEDKTKNRGSYTCEVYLCQDEETGKNIIIPELSRYQSLFVCGGSGTGKTALVYEPMIARDIEKKYFFREMAKEMAIAALKSHIAYINRPYDNDFLNRNFSLNMISPIVGKEDVYSAFMKKLTLGKEAGTTIYKNLGLTVMSPDYELISHMEDVAKNYGFTYNVIDPTNPNSIGLNPFVYDDPNKIALTISSTLQAMHTASHETEEAFKQDFTLQAIENLAIILKEMYPRMNEGALPNMSDMLKMFNNFDLIEKMCEILAHDEDLKEQYSTQLSFFKKHFYSTSSSKDYTEKYIAAAVAQLDNLLRTPGIKSILCNRHNNIDFDKMLANGDITFICTRRGDLGHTAHKAFGLFFLISMQNAVLRRPGTENTRVPNFLYIDEFPDFICKATEAIFTMYRKYRVATVISAQNLAQLDVSTSSKENFKNTILSNCANKIFTGNGVIDELNWWSAEFGKKREWTYGNTIDFKTGEYKSEHGNVKWAFVDYFSAGKLQGAITDKKAAYKVKDLGGKFLVGPGKFNYLEAKYKEPQKMKIYDFGKYSDGVTTATEDDNDTHRKKFNLKNIDFTDSRNEIDPIQTDTTDSKFLFDNDDAVIVNLKKGNPNGK